MRDGPRVVADVAAAGRAPDWHLTSIWDLLLAGCASRLRKRVILCILRAFLRTGSLT